MAPIDSSASKGEVIVSEKLQQKFVRQLSDASTALPEGEQSAFLKQVSDASTAFQEDEQSAEAVQGVLSAMVLGDDLCGSWSWHQSCGCDEKAPKLPSAPVASPASYDGVPSAVVLGDDLRGSWSWYQSACCDEKGPMLPSAPVASPAGYDGVPSAVVLGDDLRGSWSWHQRSGGFGQTGTKGKEEILDKGAPPGSIEKQPRFNCAPSSVVAGDAADRMRAWKWR